ncbi:CopG family transcriptional regulator [Haloarculaceae archaeon H-GB1-1]|nr:CopG family transcriptional regulator [Haloarculaceae archaeon H-GB1-1]
MSKITFRADDDLIEQLEEFDASKSEVMREALREFLDGGDGRPATRESTTTGESRTPSDDGSLDELIADRVDALVAERLDRAFARRKPQDINVNISVDGDATSTADGHADDESVVSHADDGRKTPTTTGDDDGANGRKTCGQCGDEVGAQHVYCPNCGEKTARRVFCECGDELRSDWGFCPGCGRRTPAADVLDNA